jgi:hypothetical protein
MKILRFSALFLIAVCIITLTAAASGEENPDTGILIGMPNPSAVWAEQRGYQFVIHTNPDGSEYGVCILPDGSEYDAWTLYRQSLIVSEEESLIGMPDPSAVWAEQRGYQFVIHTNPDGSQSGTCILPDGSEYDSWRLFREYSGVATIQPSVSTGSTFSKEPGVRSLISARLSGLFR